MQLYSHLYYTYCMLLCISCSGCQVMYCVTYLSAKSKILCVQVFKCRQEDAICIYDMNKNPNIIVTSSLI